MIDIFELVFIIWFCLDDLSFFLKCVVEKVGEKIYKRKKNLGKDC